MSLEKFPSYTYGCFSNSYTRGLGWLHVFLENWLLSLAFPLPAETSAFDFYLSAGKKEAEIPLWHFFTDAQFIWPICKKYHVVSAFHCGPRTRFTKLCEYLFTLQSTILGITNNCPRSPQFVLDHDLDFYWNCCVNIAGFGFLHIKEENTEQEMQKQWRNISDKKWHSWQLQCVDGHRV